MTSGSIAQKVSRVPGSRKPIRPLRAGAVFLIALMWTGTAGATSQPSPTESVKTAIAELMRILDNKELNRPDRADERQHQIERMLRDRVSYEEMAKRSLGVPWADLSETERQEFVDLFVRFLARSVASWKFDETPFSGKLAESTDRFVMYVSEDKLDRFSEVKTRIRSYKADTNLDFRLVNQSGHWRVYDIVVDHVSVSSNYRAQFASILKLLSLGDLEDAIKRAVPILKLSEKLTTQ